MNDVAGYTAREGAVSHGGGKAAQRGLSFSRHGRRNLPTSSGGRKEEGRIASIRPAACVPPTVKAAAPIREAFSAPQLLAARMKKETGLAALPAKNLSSIKLARAIGPPTPGKGDRPTFRGGDDLPLGKSSFAAK